MQGVRKFIRYEVKSLNLQIADMENIYQRFLIKDVSLGGVCLIFNEHLPQLQERLMVKIFGGKRQFYFKGEIVWVRDTEVGLKFLFDDLEQLINWKNFNHGLHVYNKV
jgi:hypothetical protein